MPLNGKPILVATDLSARCDRPLDRALALAQQWDTKLIVLHVMPSTQPHSDDDEILAKERILSDLPDGQANVEVVVVSGSPPEMIVKQAKECGAGLLITGVARFNGINDFFLGTAVDHIVRHADVPVLVVKQRPRKPYARLLAATDYSDCALEALLVGSQLVPDARIHLVHAYHVPYEGWLRSEEVHQYVQSEAQRQLDDFMNHLALPEELRQRITAEIGYGEIGTVIAKALRETGSDLLVLGAHGHSGFFHATIGSWAESLMSWVPVDTLIVRQPPRARGRDPT